MLAAVDLFATLIAVVGAFGSMSTIFSRPLRLGAADHGMAVSTGMCLVGLGLALIVLTSCINGVAAHVSELNKRPVGEPDKKE